MAPWASSTRCKNNNCTLLLASHSATAVPQGTAYHECAANGKATSTTTFPTTADTNRAIRAPVSHTRGAKSYLLRPWPQTIHIITCQPFYNQASQPTYQSSQHHAAILYTQKHIVCCANAQPGTSSIVHAWISPWGPQIQTTATLGHNGPLAAQAV